MGIAFVGKTCQVRHSGRISGDSRQIRYRDSPYRRFGRGAYWVTKASSGKRYRTTSLLTAIGLSWLARAISTTIYPDKPCLACPEISRPSRYDGNNLKQKDRCQDLGIELLFNRSSAPHDTWDFKWLSPFIRINQNELIVLFILLSCDV